MQSAIHEKFRLKISESEANLRKIDEEAAGQIATGTWTRKQVLGHLIDSCLNNHQRFVRASLQESYEGPSYEQEGWVKMHGYAGMPWATLVDHWASHNRLLTDVVALVPQEKYDVVCKVGADDTAGFNGRLSRSHGPSPWTTDQRLTG